MFSIGDWWLISLLDSFLGNHCYFYIEVVCTQVQRYTKVLTKCSGEIEGRRHCLKVGVRAGLDQYFWQGFLKNCASVNLWTSDK